MWLRSGPRDGFQSVKEFIPAEVKLNIIDGVMEAGCRKVQITSFASPEAIPRYGTPSPM
jgi:hydroxymethylglutaryl-CoA lyase